MLKPLSSVLEPDPRFADMVSCDEEIGTHALQIDDMHYLMQPLDLGLAVPEDIRKQFDTARNAFLYSWFAYDLATMAEQQSYAVIEMALRNRFRAEGGRSPGKRNLGGLLDIALQRGWLRREDFEVESPFRPGQQMCLLDQIGRLRNKLAHGDMHLFPDGSLNMMRLCAEILAHLFPSVGGMADKPRNGA